LLFIFETLGEWTPFLIYGMHLSFILMSFYFRLEYHSLDLLT